METIGLIACGTTKLDHPAEARNMYTGNLFRATRTYVEQRCDTWAILSAKHGLIHPTTVIDPYDLYLPRTPPQYRAQWARRVAHQVTTLTHGRTVRIVVLAGVPYRGWVPMVGVRVDVPMVGLSMGGQLHHLAQANNPL